MDGRMHNQPAEVRAGRGGPSAAYATGRRAAVVGAAGVGVRSEKSEASEGVGRRGALISRQGRVVTLAAVVRDKQDN